MVIYPFTAVATTIAELVGALALLPIVFEVSIVSLTIGTIIDAIAPPAPVLISPDAPITAGEVIGTAGTLFAAIVKMTISLHIHTPLPFASEPVARVVMSASSRALANQPLPIALLPR